jgi:hypothetical protein
MEENGAMESIYVRPVDGPVSQPVPGKKGGNRKKH